MEDSVRDRLAINSDSVACRAHEIGRLHGVGGFENGCSMQDSLSFAVGEVRVRVRSFLGVPGSWVEAGESVE